MPRRENVDPDQSSIDRSMPHRTLSPRVNEQFRKALNEALDVLDATERGDFQRVIRPTGNGSASIVVEPYFGAHTAIAFRRALENRDSLRTLDELIQLDNSELLGSVATELGSLPIQDVVSLTTILSLAAFAYRASGSSKQSAISRVLDELAALLATRSALLEEFVLVAGLSLPDEIEEVQLDEGLLLRRLTLEEVAKFSSDDISLGTHRGDCFSAGIKTALVVTRPIAIAIGERVDNAFFLQPVVIPNVQLSVEAVMLALHVAASGRASVFASYSTLLPAVLPGMTGRSSWPIATHLFPAMNLLLGDVERFKHLFKKLRAANVRPELRVAAARLRDSENRMSAVDGLLDAVIGLETLLNPNDSTELAFRVAINFAFLGNPDQRRSRYEAIRDVQKTRNKIVHGGLASGDAAIARVQEHWATARESLRDVIVRMLEDTAFDPPVRMDAEFWLDRIVPPSTQVERPE
jgi:hypothetical protein